MRAINNMQTSMLNCSTQQPRLSSCLAAVPCPYRSVRRQHTAICHAADETSSSAPIGISLLAQQYQGLVAPVQPKPSGSNPNKKKTSHGSKSKPGKAAKQANQKNSSSKVSFSKPDIAVKQSSRGKAAADKPQSQPSKATKSSSSDSSKRSSKTSSSSKAATRPKDKQQSTGSKTAAIAASAPPPLLLSGKGFGSVPAAPSSSSSSSIPSSSSSSGGGSSKQGNPKALKLFRFGVEAAVIQKAIQQNGWEGRMEQVEQLNQADVLVSVKCTPGGKHQNLQQGERAAANANIPFVVIGRSVSKHLFYKALSPHLNLQTAEERAAAAQEAQIAAENKAFADQWFKAAEQVKWGSAVPAAAGNATAALEQHSQKQKVAAQVLVQKQQQQVAGSRESRSSSSRGLTR